MADLAAPLDEREAIKVTALEVTFTGRRLCEPYNGGAVGGRACVFSLHQGAEEAIHRAQ